MRLFAALELDDSLRASLGAVRERSPLTPGPVRWVEPRNLHLTLRFLGEVEESLLTDVTEALAEASSGVAPFDISVRGLGCFPGPGAPRVLWAGVHAPPALPELARRVEEAVVLLGFDGEERAFRAHVTLARVKGRGVRFRGSRESLEAFGEQHVDGLALLESQLSPQGPRYRRLARLALGGEGLAGAGSGP